MNVYCRVMFEFNYSVGDTKNSELWEGIVCLGEGSGAKGGGKWGKGGREVGVKGEGSGCKGGKWGMPTPPPPVHPLREGVQEEPTNDIKRKSKHITRTSTYMHMKTKIKYMKSGPKVIKLFVLNTAEHEIFSANKYKNVNNC